MRHAANIYRLGIKELRSLWRDPMMLFLILFWAPVNYFIVLFLHDKVEFLKI